MSIRDLTLTPEKSPKSRALGCVVGRAALDHFGVGLPALLVIFSARSPSFLMSGDHCDRIVLSHGCQMTEALLQHHDIADALGLPQSGL